MIEASKAEELIKKNFLDLEEELVELNSLGGRVLSKPLIAKRDQPPFDRVAMDGIAIKYSKSLRSFKIEGIQGAGSPAMTLQDNESALEVMTGATLPLGTSTVIPYEKIKIENGLAEIDPDYNLEDQKNIHFFKSDYPKGEVLLEEGSFLSSPAVALAAGQGETHLMVKKLPRVAIISTGDELIDPGNECKPWEIWRSNPFGISSELSLLGFTKNKVELFHLEDNEESMEVNLRKILDSFSLIILTGGISMGKYDFVEKILSELKVKKIFHKIKQKPGKPMYFGTGESGQVIFGLPGNPVASQICLRKYIVPALKLALGRVEEKQFAVLQKEVIYKKDFTYFLAVKISYREDGSVHATPIDSNGSGDFRGLGLSDGFLELPANEEKYLQGRSYRYIPWGNKW